MVLLKLAAIADDILPHHPSRHSPVDDDDADVFRKQTEGREDDANLFVVVGIAQRQPRVHKEKLIGNNNITYNYLKKHTRNNQNRTSKVHHGKSPPIRYLLPCTAAAATATGRDFTSQLTVAMRSYAKCPSANEFNRSVPFA